MDDDDLNAGLWYWGTDFLTWALRQKDLYLSLAAYAFIFWTSEGGPAFLGLVILTLTLRQMGLERALRRLARVIDEANNADSESKA